MVGLFGSMLAHWLVPDKKNGPYLPVELEEAIKDSKLSDEKKYKISKKATGHQYGIMLGKRWILVMSCFAGACFIVWVIWAIVENELIPGGSVGGFFATAGGIAAAVAIPVVSYLVSRSQYDKILHNFLGYGVKVSTPMFGYLKRAKLIKADVEKIKTGSSHEDRENTVRIKTVKESEEIISGVEYRCDSCDAKIIPSMQYCSKCGNKLDWPDDIAK